MFLLHNGNKLASVPIGHSIQMKETYENMKTILDTTKYAGHVWVICGDLRQGVQSSICDKFLIGPRLWSHNALFFARKHTCTNPTSKFLFYTNNNGYTKLH